MAISIRDGTYVAVAIDSSTVALTDVIAIVITVSVAVALQGELQPSAELWLMKTREVFHMTR